MERTAALCTLVLVKLAPPRRSRPGAGASRGGPATGTAREARETGSAGDSPQAGQAGVVLATARVDVRTKALVRRLRPGEIAVIDHVDLDRVCAEELLAARVGAVVNAAACVSGRYPARGTGLLLEAGVPVLDRVGGDLLDAVREGEMLLLAGSSLSRVVPRGAPEVVGVGDRLSGPAVAAVVTAARTRLTEQVEAFACNTLEHLHTERSALLESEELPPLRTAVAGRQAVLVARGAQHREDLASLRHYVRRQRPLLVGVDGGADALLAEGWQPDLIVGDMDSVSDSALTCGAELVVHAYRDGRAPGLDRLVHLGLDAVLFSVVGTSEDAAMRLLDELGIELIVAVGTHATMEEFFDKGRAGMASTFLTRLRLGDTLVDAKGVSRLYQRSSARRTWLVAAAALIAAVTAVACAVLLGGSRGGVVTPVHAQSGAQSAVQLMGQSEGPAGLRHHVGHPSADP